jgi:hypothetical protein
VQAAGSLPGGLYYTADTLPIADTDNPVVAAYLSEMKAEGHTSEIDDTSANSWMSGVVLAMAIEQLGAASVSRAALLNLLEYGLGQERAGRRPHGTACCALRRV